MNKRIRELIDRAGGIHRDEDGQELTPVLMGSGLEHLAELLILECALIVETKQYYDERPAGDVIKEHFGVEQ